jgi:hypothetical protein
VHSDDQLLDRLMRLAIATVALIALFGSIAQAQTENEVLAVVPKKVGAFVPYCTNHIKDCQSVVVFFDTEPLSKPEAHSCTIGTVDKEAATKSILSWLARREETHSMPTKLGIRTAIRVLWPC